jgi:hypothetical protein
MDWMKNKILVFWCVSKLCNRTLMRDGFSEVITEKSGHWHRFWAQRRSGSSLTDSQKRPT